VGRGRVWTGTWAQGHASAPSSTIPATRERPKDHGNSKRTLNAAREALVTEERAQQRTLARLRSDKAKIIAAEIQLKEEKEKSASICAAHYTVR